MNNPMTWDYRQLTEEALELLVLLSEYEPEEVKKDRAYGVYLLWDFLTMGGQAEGDNERLLTLAAPSRAREKECKETPEFIRIALQEAVLARLEEIKNRERLATDSELAKFLGISPDELEDICRRGSCCALHELYPFPLEDEENT